MATIGKIQNFFRTLMTEPELEVKKPDPTALANQQEIDFEIAKNDVGRGMGSGGAM
jgi:hypothetical protein